MSEVDQAMFKVIDGLTDIAQLTDNVFSDELNDSNINSELSDRLQQDLNNDFNYDLANGRPQAGQHEAKSDDDSKEYRKLTTPSLEESSLSLLDHALTDEEIVKYLSLFSENDFQLVDDLDIENNLKPCSSINSNATTVSTQETNEFRESLLNSADQLNCSNHGDTIQTADQVADDDDAYDESKAFDANESGSYQVISSQTNVAASQTPNDHGNQVYSSQTVQTNEQTTIHGDQMAYNSGDFENMNNRCVDNATITKVTNDVDNKMNNCQMSEQMNAQLSNSQQQQQQINLQPLPSETTPNHNGLMRNGLIEYGNQMPVNYYYSNNNQMNQFQCVTNNATSTTIPNNNLQSQMNFMNNNANLIASNNCLPSSSLPSNSLIDTTAINYCDLSNCNTFSNSSSSSSSYLAGSEYFTYECRDINCPYTYCSKYNPYYSSSFLSMQNQFRPSPNFTDNFLADTSINMNLVDNQIVFNKQSDHVFNHTNLPANQNQTATKTKRTKRKQPKNEYTETVICNETTDYAFYTYEENSQSKKKRGRKRKTTNQPDIKDITEKTV